MTTEITNEMLEALYDEIVPADHDYQPEPLMRPDEIYNQRDADGYALPSETDGYIAIDAIYFFGPSYLDDDDLQLTKEEARYVLYYWAHQHYDMEPPTDRIDALIDLVADKVTAAL